MTYLLLFWEFFKAGLFSIGGGLDTLPYLYDMSSRYPDWFSSQMVSDMLAISESTPGPIGINMATYAGYTVTGNIFGGILTSIAIVLPSLIVIVIIAKFLSKFSENRFVKSGFYGVRPAVLAFIAVTAINLLIENIFPQGAFDYGSIILFAALLLLTNVKWIKNLHPIFTIAAGAAVGIIFKF